VNVDQYPHVSDRYHCGGFPSLVVLSAGGSILWAENYLSKDQMVDNLETVLHKFYFSGHRRVSFGGSTRQGKETKATKETEETKYSEPLLFFRVREAFNIVYRTFDDENGGFFSIFLSINFLCRRSMISLLII